MKQGTAYAKLIKRLHHDLLKKHGKPAVKDPMEPLQALLVGILATDTPGTAKAHAVYHKLCEQMVDLNEMRVTPVIELAAMIDTAVPKGGDKAKRIVSALNDVRRRQDTLDLSFLRQRGRREAREYLESLEGVTPYAAAFVTLFSLGGHAIPVDELTVHILRHRELVNATADRIEVQSFLERNVSASDAIEFAQLLGTYVGEQAGKLPPKKLNEILNPPPPAPPPPPPPVIGQGEQATAVRASATAAQPKESSARTKSKTPAPAESKAAAKSQVSAKAGGGRGPATSKVAAPAKKKSRK